LKLKGTVLIWLNFLNASIYEIDNQIRSRFAPVPFEARYKTIKRLDDKTIKRQKSIKR